MNFWNTTAREFDSLYDTGGRTHLFNVVFRQGLFQRTEQTCDVVRRLGSPSVLDVGCGSGRSMPPLLAAGASHIAGIDSAENMLDLADGLLKSAGLRDRVEFILSDFLTAAIDTKFDLVVALGVFDYLHEELPQFLIKMRECAKTGVVFSAPGRSLLRMPLRAWRYKRHGVRVHFYRRADLEALCRAAGFQNFSIARLRSSGFLVTAWTSLAPTDR